MAAYQVTKTWKYTETVVIEADSAGEAEILAYEEMGERNNDDTLDDIKVNGVLFREPV